MSFNILHILRAPVGGLFRHVVDLARGQAARGHRVGLIADATTGALRAEEVLREISSLLALGIIRVPMSRDLGWSDLAACRKVTAHVRACAADVVHGHGAKGGAYARLVARGSAIRVYTPHGGSLHYSRRSPLGLIYLSLERVLMPRTELFLFESVYGQDVFAAQVGQPKGLSRVVHNGVGPAEFAPVITAADATDVVCVGELRTLKGVDVLLDAIGLLTRAGQAVSATIVGEGPDAGQFRSRATALGLSAVHFTGALPARVAFARGRILVVPSRAESLPYIVLEGGAAGRPIIATAVGGIGEIFGPDAGWLIGPANPRALADAVRTTLADPQAAGAMAARLRTRIAEKFSLDSMTDQILAGYSEALGMRR